MVPLTAAAAGAGPNLTLQLADVVFLPAGRGVYFEVYANLPAGAAPDPDGPRFVGIRGRSATSPRTTRWAIMATTWEARRPIPST